MAPLVARDRPERVGASGVLLDRGKPVVEHDRVALQHLGELVVDAQRVQRGAVVGELLLLGGPLLVLGVTQGRDPRRGAAHVAARRQGGFTQISKVLSHARRESEAAKVNALVYVGDCMEEDVDQLSQLAGELGLIGLPVFLFQEGREPKAERAFREIARLSRGAYCPFDAGSAKQLRELLTAVAVYATGGRKALQDFSDETNSGAALRLLEQLG